MCCCAAESAGKGAQPTLKEGYQKTITSFSQREFWAKRHSTGPKRRGKSVTMQKSHFGRIADIFWHLYGRDCRPAAVDSSDGLAAGARKTRRGAHSCDPPSVRVTARLPRKHVIALDPFGGAARASKTAPPTVLLPLVSCFPSPPASRFRAVPFDSTLCDCVR